MSESQRADSWDEAATLYRLSTAFEENFARGGELGASLCVFRAGEVVATLAAGYEDAARSRPWTRDSRVLWWSATKPLSAAAMLLALSEAGIRFDEPVASVWPEFAAGGKSAVSFLDLLSHRAGLPGIPGVLIDPYDHDAVAAALAAMTPLWPLGTGHGYHARTLGYLADEVVRRTAGVSLGSFWLDRIAQPAGLDFFIGIGEADAPSVADSLPPSAMRLPPGEQSFFEALSDPGSLTALAFRSPSGDIRPRTMNSTRARTFGFPALGGIGTAEGMAGFYAMVLAGGTVGERRVLPKTVCEALTKPLASGVDKILLMPTTFSAGAMLDPLDPATGIKLRSSLGPSHRTFGHPGAGGCLAFADPDDGIVFAYCMNRMDVGVMPSERAAALVRALYA